MADLLRSSGSSARKNRADVRTEPDRGGSSRASRLLPVRHRLQADFVLVRDRNTPLSLIYLDLNNFSQLVKLCGTNTGDAILKRVAESLRRELRSRNYLVQFGREGFVALIDGLGREASVHVAQRLQKRIRDIQMGTVAGHNVYIFQHTGIASCPEDGRTITELPESAQRRLALRAGQAEPGTSNPAAECMISKSCT